MGNFLSKYLNYLALRPEEEVRSKDANEEIDDNSHISNKSESEKEAHSSTPPEQIDCNAETAFTTPSKLKNGNSKVFAAFVPDSPERFAFNDFTELKSFLNSPVGKKKGTRFKRCEDEKDLASFFNEQLSISTCNDENNIPSSSIEQDLPYKEIPARRLTDFRVAIEKCEHEKFDKLLLENPRFLVNTSNDLPTILHIGYRYNALHVAARSSNILAVQKILSHVCDKSWLVNAYATETCMEERSENLLNAILNTPDKIENNTPLHYACKMANAEIVEMLLNYGICKREPLNSHNETPLDMLVLYGVATFNDCKRARELLIAEVEEAKKDLRKRGI